MKIETSNGKLMVERSDREKVEFSNSDVLFGGLLFTCAIILVFVTLYYFPHTNGKASDESVWWLWFIVPAILAIVDTLLSFWLQRPQVYEKYRFHAFFGLLSITMILLYLLYPKTFPDPDLGALLYIIMLFFGFWYIIILIFGNISEYFIKIIFLPYLGFRKNFDAATLNQGNILIYKKPPELDDETVYRLIVNTMMSLMGYNNKLKVKWINSKKTAYILKEGWKDNYPTVIIFYKNTIAILLFREYFRDLSVDAWCKNLSNSMSYVFMNTLNFEKVEDTNKEISEYVNSIILEYSSRDQIIETILNFIKDIQQNPKNIISELSKTTPILLIIFFIEILHYRLWESLLEIIDNNLSRIILMFAFITAYLTYLIYTQNKKGKI